jgi:hypothetical protein
VKKACQYAIIQFVPHPETREFANVGIVVLCPQERFFGFRLLKKYGRVTRFFEQMDNRIFIDGKKVFQDELVRIQQMVLHDLLDETRTDTADVIRLFADLTRDREAIFRFDQPAVALTENAKATLDELYKYYVEREFVTKEYQERLMEKVVRRMLQHADLADRFKDREIGDELYHARFPFVDDEKTKVIKPLTLDQGEPTKIFAHADHWLAKIKRLRERNSLPGNVLFPLTPPPANDDMCVRAYDDVRNELEALGIQVTTVKEIEKILTFAKG